MVGNCICAGDDALAAKACIRRAQRVVTLADESHFMASVCRCATCGQYFVTLFCERIDWAGGDDPQTWMAVPVTGDEVRRLHAANVAAEENAMLQIVVDERRFLYHDMPKGAPEKLVWMTRTLFIPGHD